jgi:hypothetical protein
LTNGQMISSVPGHRVMDIFSALEENFSSAIRNLQERARCYSPKFSAYLKGFYETPD